MEAGAGQAPGHVRVLGVPGVQRPRQGQALPDWEIGIRVVEIMPGPIETDMLRESERMPEAAAHADYRAQAELLTVPCEAVIKRSLREQTSLIIEGVHVQNSLLDKFPDMADTITIPITLAVLNRQILRDRFRGRGEKIDARRADRYLEHFDSIWRLQSYLLSEADRLQTPIIINDNKEQS